MALTIHVEPLEAVIDDEVGAILESGHADSAEILLAFVREHDGDVDTLSEEIKNIEGAAAWASTQARRLDSEIDRLEIERALESIPERPLQLANDTVRAIIEHLKGFKQVTSYLSMAVELRYHLGQIELQELSDLDSQLALISRIANKQGLSTAIFGEHKEMQQEANGYAQRLKDVLQKVSQMDRQMEADISGMEQGLRTAEAKVGYVQNILLRDHDLILRGERSIEITRRSEGTLDAKSREELIRIERELKEARQRLEQDWEDTLGTAPPWRA